MQYISAQDIMFLSKEDFVTSEKLTDFRKSNLKEPGVKNLWNAAALVLLKVGNINYTVLKTRY